MAIDTTKAVTGASTDAIKNFVKMVSDHRNLLDNPWFTVAQAGYNGNHGSVKYACDRWICDASTFTSNGLTIPANKYLVQRLENTDFLVGKTTTLSVMVGDGRVFSGSMEFKGSGTHVYFNTDGIYAYQETNGGYRSIVIWTNANIPVVIKAVKLELGSVSTLAYDSPPNCSEELAKCQAYYWKCNLSAIFGHPRSAITSCFNLPLPVPLKRPNNTSVSFTNVKKYVVGYTPNAGSDSNSSTKTVSGFYIGIYSPSILIVYASHATMENGYTTRIMEPDGLEVSCDL